MNRAVEWVRFVVNIIVKSGFLGKYELAPTSHTKGVKLLERTILSMEDEIRDFKSKNEVLNEKLNDAIIKAIDANQKLEFMKSRGTDAEGKLSTLMLERGHIEKELSDLKSTLKQAETLSEQLKVEMKKWRT